MSAILKFIIANPQLCAEALVALCSIVVSILGHMGYIKAATTAKAKTMLSNGATVSEITDVTRLIVPEVQKIAAAVAKNGGK